MTRHPDVQPRTRDRRKNKVELLSIEFLQDLDILFGVVVGDKELVGKTLVCHGRRPLPGEPVLDGRLLVREPISCHHWVLEQLLNTHQPNYSQSTEPCMALRLKWGRSAGQQCWKDRGGYIKHKSSLQRSHNREERVWGSGKSAELV